MICLWHSNGRSRPRAFLLIFHSKIKVNIFKRLIKCLCQILARILGLVLKFYFYIETIPVYISIQEYAALPDQLLQPCQLSQNSQRFSKYLCIQRNLSKYIGPKVYLANWGLLFSRLRFLRINVTNRSSSTHVLYIQKLYVSVRRTDVQISNEAVLLHQHQHCWTIDKSKSEAVCKQCCCTKNQRQTVLTKTGCLRSSELKTKRVTSVLFFCSNCVHHTNFLSDFSLYTVSTIID